MNEDERLYIYERTLHHMRTGQYDYAILEDIAQPDNYVQCGAVDSTYRQLLVEVTSRLYDDQELPPLSSEQIDALAALSFSRQASPNYAQRIPFDDQPQIARLFEQCFTILGCDDDFDVMVKDTGFWMTNPIQIEAEERAARHRRERPGRDLWTHGNRECSDNST